MSEAVLKTLVCDDEAPALELITAMLRQTGNVEIVASCRSSAEALEIINRGGVDLVVLDIEMPELTGVAAAKSIEASPKPLLIFATAHAEYAVDAFGIDAIDYILKPFDQDRVTKAVEKAVRLVSLIGSSEADPVVDTDSQGKAEALRLTDAGRHYIIPYGDIIWAEAAGDYSLLHRSDSEIAIRRTLTSLEDILPKDRFRRIHRSSIIGINHISEVKKLPKGEAEILLTGGAVVRASRSYRDVISSLMR